MSRPVILVDGHVLDEKPQGSAAFIAWLYSALAETGAVLLKIATSRAESLERWQLKRPEIDWVPLRASNKYQRLAIEMGQLQSRIAPDYAHFQYITPLSKRCRWINSLHDLLFLDHPQYFPLGYRIKNAALFRASALRSDVILTGSDYSRDAIRRHFRVDAKRVHVTPHSFSRFVGAPEAPVGGLEPGRFVVYVSRFEPRKNQHGLVRAFIEPGDGLPDDIRLVLVGHPALPYPELEAALGAAGDRVTVMNGLSLDELTWLYRHAACSIYPSFAEGFGMPVMEAVAAGGLSYCADNTAMSELAPYVHGTFDAGNGAQIRATMERALGGHDVTDRAEVQRRALAAFSKAAAVETVLRAINA